MAKADDGTGQSEAVDLDVLREVTDGDRDLMQELAELYVNDADLQLRALDDALENNDLDRIKRIGHSLKGSSASIGANEVQGTFARMEKAAQGGKAEDLREIIRLARTQFVRVRKALGDLR